MNILTYADSDFVCFSKAKWGHILWQMPLIPSHSVSAPDLYSNTLGRKTLGFLGFVYGFIGCIWPQLLELILWSTITIMSFIFLIFILNILRIVHGNFTELLILAFFSFKVVCLKGVSWAENFVMLHQKLRVVSGWRFFSKAMLSILKISDSYLFLRAAFIAWERTR